MGSVDAFLAGGSNRRDRRALSIRLKGYLTVDGQYFELDIQVLVDEARVRLAACFLVIIEKLQRWFAVALEGSVWRVSDPFDW